VSEHHTDRPNVIVLLTDQQRWDCTSFAGNPLDLMPNYERLAQEGTWLPHTVTCQPVCGPARSSLQTGLYATETGCFRNGIPLPPDIPTLAHHFRGAGYQTGYIGKWHLADDNPVPETERGGYETWLASNTLEFTSEAYQTRVFDNDGAPVDLPGYRADALTDAAIRFIDTKKADPFFLFVSYLEPHHQNRLDSYPAPDGYRQRYEGRWTPPDLAALGGTSQQHLAGYWGMVKRLDECLGRIMDALKSLDLRKNTIVLFTSDHGCHFKTRNNEYKRSCHDASVRVPAMLVGPGFDGGGRVNELVSLVDLPPTLLDATGISQMRPMQGRSILPLLRGERNDWPREAFIQISESKIARAIRTHRWKYEVTAEGSSWDAPGATVYRESHLYDLENDPYELDNLAGLPSVRELCDMLGERLLARMFDAGEPEAVIEPASSSRRGQHSILSAEAGM
jgi:arylsulfatase A-like enzyme